ncbi:DUF302 domain-containing protein [Roseovarius sp. D22-M7]|uniref:DUF302 domain-containing protein n=1 Tax=Roseovarius sp. D22-M7 TaxID=3127116 RepID=UPI0030102BA8
MSYTINRTITGAVLDDVEMRTRTALSDHGFGVLTEIDVQSTLQKKLGVNIDGYRILGACNPEMAHEAMKIEPKVGAMLPCNVILREVSDGVCISAIDPVASMEAIDNDDLKDVARDVREMLAQVVKEI